MMTKKKTPNIKRAKFALILPIVALLLFAFAEPQYHYNEPEQLKNDILKVEKKSDQELTINGKVINADTNQPMPGASIVIKGTTIGTVSDKDGSFTIKNPTPKIGKLKSGHEVYSTELVFSYVGYGTFHLRINSDSKSVQDPVTVKLNNSVIVIDTEIPPPPPPPAPEHRLPTEKEWKKAASSVDSPSDEKEVFFVVEDMPKYPGGHYEMLSHVHVMQRDLAAEKKLKGKAKVAFTVDASGKVSDIKVVEKDNDGAANGAYMIAKEMEDWTPGKQRGKAVPVKYLLPVEFK